MKTYTEEFKKTIVELYENGNKNKSELAREYGTSEGNVRVWIAMYWVNSNISSIEHFADVGKLSKRANNAEVEIRDYKLTCCECYLIVQNVFYI